MTALPVAAAAFLMAAAAARPVTTIDLAHCLGVADGSAESNPGRCPVFISDAFKAALDACHDAGGKLVPARGPAVWQLDVNGDRKPEYLFEIGANVACEGAYSIFECGSLGCPYSLYEQRGAVWRVIGTLDVADPESIEMLAAGTSAGGLKSLTREIAVRATPDGDGAVLDRYGRDSEVVVLGEAPGTPYYYVAPCNACARGFIEKSAVRETESRPRP